MGTQWYHVTSGTLSVLCIKYVSGIKQHLSLKTIPQFKSHFFRVLVKLFTAEGEQHLDQWRGTAADQRSLQCLNFVIHLPLISTISLTVLLLITSFIDG